MAVSETRAKIVGRIWQSIASSGVAVNALPREQLETLVEHIADGVLRAMDEEIAAAGAPERAAVAEEAPLNEEEVVLWEGRPFFSFTTMYRITNERVRVISGFVGKDYEDIELIRIQDLDHTQGLSERMLGIGDVIIQSHDPSHPEMILRNVPDPHAVHEILRRAMLEARKRFRYSVQEEM